MINNRPYSTVFLIAIISLSVLFSFSPGLCQEADSTGDKTIEAEAARVMEELKTPDLPAYLNGLTKEKLKGIDRIEEQLNKINDIRGGISGRLYLLSFIRSRLNDALKAGGQVEDQMELSRVFPNGFEPATLKSFESAIEKEQMPDEYKKPAIEALKEKMELLKLETFEKDLQEEGKTSPKRARIFYDNARQKMENSIKDSLEQLKIQHHQYAQEATAFARRNIAVAFRIGTDSKAGNVRKSFKPGENLWIGFTYGTQLIPDKVPVQWKITYPDKQFKIGNTSLEGETLDGAMELFSENLGKSPQKGSYTVEVIAYPDTDHRNIYRDTFSVGEPAVQIKSAFILDGNKKASGIFLAGSPVLLVLQYVPPFNSNDNGNFSWTVTNPSGEKVANLSIAKNLKLKTTARDIQTKYVKGVIPKDAESGAYRYEASITHKGETFTSKEVEFLVRSGFTAQILPSKTKIKKGQKVVLNSKVLGGKAPYQYKWEADTGGTSAKNSIAIVFNNPGKRKITLTVTDSTPKKPNKAVTYVHIQVTD